MIVLVALSFVLGLYFYPNMPEQIPSHWNVQGQVDGYSSRFLGVFLIPFILTGLLLLFLFIPKIDPLKTNIETFRKYYDRFVVVVFIFMIFIQLQILFWSKGNKISPNFLMPIGLGLLFYYIGVLCEHTKRNWFIGIRTPWTLSSDIVWEKTNKLGGILFKIAGIISFFGLLAQQYAFLFIMIPVLLSVAVLVVYSYVEFKKELNTKST